MCNSIQVLANEKVIFALALDAFSMFNQKLLFSIPRILFIN